MSLSPDDAGELLRARGMRSTPQRRAILSIFRGGRTEHLSADEVYAQASRSLPDLSRGTVYATLAEFSELGLLSAFGSPEPVRYETNLELHAHFRCHLCLRVFDLVGGQQNPEDIPDPGFVVELVETRAEGICDECTAYDAGLSAGARSIMTAAPPADALSRAGVAVTEMESPLGPLLLAATPLGLTRLAFDDHADAAALRGHASSRRGSQAARQHLADAAASLRRYFSGELGRPVSAIDWTQLQPAARALLATEAIPYATHRSYSQLDQNLSAHDLGHMFGANPIPLFMPCHRVARGTETPSTFVGGAIRRQWLEAHEQAHPLG
jgi:Fe2+ or Zn2+ uptake regulation protein/O6-methylguanine-DNA--protein-cysteine methyltransferase